MDPVVKAPVEGIAPEAPKSETLAAPAVAPVADPNAARLDQLTRKEKALRHQARQLEAQRQAFQAEQTKLKSQPQAPDWKSRMKQDFAGMLAEAGLTPDDVAQQIINTSSSDVQLKTLAQKLSEQEAKITEMSQTYTESQKKAYDGAVKQLRRDVEGLVNSDPSFETIQATKNYDAVVSLVEQTYNEDGYLMTAKEAAQQIEDYLVEEAVNLAKLKKIQQKLAPQGDPVEKTEQVQKTSQPTSTLTHGSSQGAPKGISNKDRRERAIMAFQGKLK